jgi:hypothetical protein
MPFFAQERKESYLLLFCKKAEDGDRGALTTLNNESTAFRKLFTSNKTPELRKPRGISHNTL